MLFTRIDTDAWPEVPSKSKAAVSVRNDFLHTGAFPTRPTNGNCILQVDCWVATPLFIGVCHYDPEVTVQAKLRYDAPRRGGRNFPAHVNGLDDYGTSLTGARQAGRLRRGATV